VKAQFLLALTIIAISAVTPVFAHKTVFVEQYEIEVGWSDEPPLVSQQNTIVFAFTVNEDEGVSTGVTNAFRDLTATIKSGSVSKQLDVLSDSKAGHYYSKIIPTQTGPLAIELKGTINGVAVNEVVQIESVESINVIAFPPTDASGLPDLAKIKNSLAQLQQDVAQIQQGGASVGESGKSYDYAMFAMGLGAAGIILAVISLIKRK